MPIILAVAAAVTPAGVAPAEDSGERVIIDIKVPAPCENEQDSISDEIVVCGTVDRAERYRVPRLTTVEETTLPRARFDVSDSVAVSAEAEAVDLGMARSNRAMVRVKIKF